MCHCCKKCRQTRVCLCSRWLETPMRVYYGPGVSERDLTERTDGYLRAIAEALERAYPKTRC